MTDKTPISEHDITQLLRNRYSGSDWAFVSQVPNGTGMAKSRTADALAMSLWPSKGLHLHGFEVKVSRNDWLKEIQDPEKAHAFARHCHYWWVVAPGGVVQPAELAGSWGLMEVTRQENLRVKKAADFVSPESIDFALLAGIFRACCREGAEAELDAAFRRGREAGKKEAAKMEKWHGANDKRRAEQERDAILSSVAKFEAASGIKIDSYNGKRMGELVAAVQALNCGELKGKLRNTVLIAGAIAKNAEEALEDLP